MSHLPSATLNEVCDFQNGGTPSKAVERYFTGDIPWITGADLVGPVARNARSFITEEAITSSATNRVPAGTVLLVTRTSVGKVAIAGTELCFSQDITALLPDSARLDAGYLVHFLRTKEDHFSRYARGATIKGITRQVVADLVVPLPPLEEQRRIAEILDQAETLRTQRRTALALLDSLTQSLFLDMFGEPVANPKGWQLEKLGKLTSKMGSGSTPSGGDAAYKTEGISLIRSLNVHDGDFKYKNLAHIDEVQAAKLSNVQVAEGDVLLNITGASVARVCRAPADVLPARVNQHVMIVRPTAALNGVFLERMLLSDTMKRALLQIGGAGATREAITKAQAEELLVPLPPLPLQQTFATRIASIEALKATHRRALAALDALFSSLQQRAFSGELTLAAPRSPAQSLEQLQQLEASIGLEALIFIAKRMPDGDLYNSLKAIYFADRHHLEHHGHQIYNETYCALPHGPVPQSAYDATRVLIGERMFSDFDDDAMRAALRRNDKKLTALRDADFSKLSRSVVESLEWAVRYCSDMKFGQTKTASHDSAYERTPKNEAIPLQYIIDTLPPEARQRHWNL